MKKIEVIVVLCVVFIISSFANTPDNKDGQITGRVFDSESKQPIEYATVSLSDINGKLITGTVTNNKGLFSIEKINYDTYIVTISFLGYENITIKTVVLNSNQRNVNLSDIYLTPSSENLEEVTIVSDNAPVQYKIDKKIINVSKQFSSISGTAIDVLQNIPSIRVDIEGNVSLRGSSGFTVLIDGRPTILDANDALEQIPASNIQNIELITNPSVKYDPDGNAGIINIITKKKKMKGVSGIADLNVGLDDKYGVDFLVNFKLNNVNLFINADYNHRYFPSFNESEQRTISNDTTYFVTLDGVERGGREYKGIRTGLEWDISKKDFFSIGFRVSDRQRKQISEQNFTEWIEKNNGQVLDEQFNISKEYGFRGGSRYSLSANYKHNFTKEGHDIIAYLDYQSRKSKEESNNELRHEDIIIEGSRNVEEGPSSRLTAKLEYTLTLREKDKFEAGLQGRFSNSEDITGLYTYVPDAMEYVLQPTFDHATNYVRNIFSVYSLYAASFRKFGIQGGLRGEYTSRDIITDVEENLSISNRFDIFPTFHLSYNYTEDLQAMASYSRRINRPRGYYFEPFLTWQDAYNIRKGNPELIPEYTNSYELGILRTRNENFISFEGFYRVTQNKIERIRSVYSKDVFLHSILNVGTDYTLGAELALRLNIKKRWEIDLSGSIFDYRVTGELEGESFDQTSFNWDGRWNNTLKVTKTTHIQINSHYDSPSATVQGNSKGHFSADVSVKQSLLDRKLSAILQIRDILGTAKRESTSEGPTFYYYRYHYHKSPVVMLTLIYNFNNYEFKKRERNGGEGNGEEEEY